MNDAITLVRDWANEYGLSAYQEQTGKGLLRHLVLRYSDAGEMMVGLVINGDQLPHAKELIRNLRINLPEVYSVLVNRNKERGSQILGGETQAIFGSERILEEIATLSFDISLNTFLQVNHAQTELLYQTVFKLARVLPGEVVADLYCGAGTMSLYAAKLGAKVYGIEIVPQAVADAKANAAKNGLENAEFYCADCADGFAQIAEQAGKIDVLIVDPPRKGLDQKVIEDIARYTPGRVVYVSCDPATLARDLALFQQKGYAPRFIQPVDMFPQTTHVETVVYLSKLKSDEHVKVEVDMSEFEPTGSERRKLGTYEEIKKYILDKYGFKVPTLYISQIKRKVGVDLRPNYNPAKSDSYKQPQCTPEKEEAIMDALRYFKYIE